MSGFLARVLGKLQSKHHLTHDFPTYDNRASPYTSSTRSRHDSLPNHRKNVKRQSTLKKFVSKCSDNGRGYDRLSHGHEHRQPFRDRRATLDREETENWLASLTIVDEDELPTTCIECLRTVESSMLFDRRVLDGSIVGVCPRCRSQPLPLGRRKLHNHRPTGLECPLSPPHTTDPLAELPTWSNPAPRASTAPLTTGSFNPFLGPRAVEPTIKEHPRTLRELVRLRPSQELYRSAPSHHGFQGNDPYSSSTATSAPTLSLESPRPRLWSIPVNERNCSICMTAWPETYLVRPTSRCKHPGECCRGCLEQWVNSQLDSRGYDNVVCPETRCKRIFTATDIQKWARVDTFEKYNTLSFKALLSQDPDFFWCLRPGCKSGQIHSSGADGPIFRCTACGFKACIIHKRAWHEGYTCQEHDYRMNGSLRRKEELASKKTIDKTTKPCPKCRTNIEKIGGCEHVKCLQCRYQFCWLCLADYTAILTGDNSRHRRSCRFYRT